MPYIHCSQYLFLVGLMLGLGGCQQDTGTPVTALNKLTKAGLAPNLKPPKTGPALKDFGVITDVHAKKRAFFDYLQPQIEQENNHIGKLKEHFATLKALLKKQGRLHPNDADWLNRVAILYRVDAEDPAQQLDTLNTKLGKIPPALVKAQAANESAWGTSRFARQANNLFGQWCFTPGCGIAPLQRNPDDTHEVQSFPSVAAGLRSYFVNINGHQSYTPLRQIRRCMQTNKQPYSGRALAAGLVNYSARGGHYVEELQSMIRINKLENWSTNWWGKNNPNHPCYNLVQVQADHPDPVNDDVEVEVEVEVETEVETELVLPQPTAKPSISNPSVSSLAASTAVTTTTMLTKRPATD